MSSKYITTKKLVDEVKKLRLGIAAGSIFIEVFDKKTDHGVAGVSRCIMMKLDTTYGGWGNISKETQEKLYNLLDCYARTPLDKREEQKKCHFKLDIDKKLQQCNDILKTQLMCLDNDYMRGMYNGMEFVISSLEERKPNYRKKE